MLAILLLLLAVGVVLYPIVYNKMDMKQQSYILTEYEQQVKNMNESEVEKIWAEADKYNAALAPIQLHDIDEVIEDEDYNSLLYINQTGLMCHVEIPKINVNLPVYHGTSAEVLDIGVGHLQGSALPVGGIGTHCVVTGHSGVAGKKLFSDLDQLRIGDIFYIHILGKTLAYQVKEINIVLPHEAELLAPRPGEDLCTLITCTPYAVNTHRLLVTGSRIPYEEAQIVEESIERQIAEEPVKSTWEEGYLKELRTLGIGVGAFVLLFGVVIFLLAMKKRKKQKKGEEND